MRTEDNPTPPSVRASAGAEPASASLAFRPRPATAGRIEASAQSRGRRIGILIVAYNAVTTIAKVLRRIPPDVWECVEEVVVFDDASGDHTYELAVGLKTLSGLEKLTVIKNETNKGYGGNQKLGYRYFMDKGFDIVVLLHGDGQYAPEILSHLYTPIVAGEADAVFGSRMMKAYGGALKGGMPLYKYLGNKILTFFESKALDMRLTEFHSGYRAYSLHALRDIGLDNMADIFHFDTQIIIKLHHQGFRIKEVPIPTYYGAEICYVNGLNYARDVFMSVIRYHRTRRGVARYPEFEEYYVHYALKTSRRSSHEYFQRWVGLNCDVLDLGCGEGYFAERLNKNGNRVVGVDELAAPKHEALLDRYIRADLSQGLAEVVPHLGHRTFDRVLLQDIVEHIPQPARLLEDCRKVLRARGELLVSVPNIANITVRLSLLFGRFEYAERGILDRTHLRFFTRKSARHALEHAGYEIVEEKASVMPVELALGLSAENPLMRIANAILGIMTAALPGLFGYQILFRARARDSAVRG
jgi:2-polyprenyl-3-methyl-5-hydroxy-6-metoxy-1,4-benzoquinol methylase